MSSVVPILILSVVGMILQGIFIAVDHKDKFVPAVVLKGSASLVFVIVGFIGYGKFLGSSAASNTDATQGLTRTVCLMICLGLVFGMLGDILLALRFVFKAAKHQFFLAGTLIFFIGHIFYMVALVPMSSNLLISVLIGAVVAAFILVILYKTMEVNQAYRLFGIFYIEAVVIMSAIAIGNRITVASAFRTWYAVGAVLFMISDLVMIYNSFGKEHRAFLRLMNLSLYYVGQLLIATSILFYA